MRRCWRRTTSCRDAAWRGAAAAQTRPAGSAASRAAPSPPNRSPPRAMVTRSPPPASASLINHAKNVAFAVDTNIYYLSIVWWYSICSLSFTSVLYKLLSVKLQAFPTFIHQLFSQDLCIFTVSTPQGLARGWNTVRIYCTVRIYNVRCVQTRVKNVRKTRAQSVALKNINLT